MAKKKSKIAEEIEREAIAIVNTERTNWEDAICYVTDKVAFRMRELIKTFRKNYWGIFDEPIDKQTGREKFWIGLAMATVENWVKNTDTDQKDIGFLARLPDGRAITEITRLVVRDDLDRRYFGETLDTDERQACIDGTVVWKTWKGPKGKAERRTVDLLNFYIDPTEENIQKAYRVTERALMTPDQIRAMSGWTNTDDLTGSNVLPKADYNRTAGSGTQTTGDFRDVWEMWGKAPKWLITGDKKAEDAKQEVDVQIIVSGLEAGKPALHLIKENKNEDKFGNVLKPYEELRPAVIAGRWYGLGIVERILALQEYLNLTINVRVNRNIMSQLGLFKIKKGKGITAQMLNRLPSNGAIQVQDMDDVEQMVINDVGQSSYNDEEVIKYWAQQVSSAQQISSGEIMPASSTATSAAIANTNAKTGYTMFKEAVGSFIERWIDRHYMPITAKTVKQGDIYRILNDDDKFKELAETVAMNNVMDELENGPVIPSAQELQQVLDAEVERMKSQSHIFVENVQEIMAEMLDTKVKVTNEDLDTSVTIANIIQMMQIPPEMKNSEEVAMVYDLMGLPAPKKQQPVMPGMPQPGMPMEGQPAPTMTGEMSSSLLRGQMA